jgi:hypothetical protein
VIRPVLPHKQRNKYPFLSHIQDFVVVVVLFAAYPNREIVMQRVLQYTTESYA